MLEMDGLRSRIEGWLQDAEVRTSATQVELDSGHPESELVKQVNVCVHYHFADLLYRFVFTLPKKFCDVEIVRWIGRASSFIRPIQRQMCRVVRSQRRISNTFRTSTIDFERTFRVFVWTNDGEHRFLYILISIDLPVKSNINWSYLYGLTGSTKTSRCDAAISNHDVASTARRLLQRSAKSTRW